MTFEQMNYVLEVEKTRSINKAASNLFISQSALSLAIQNLEKELGSRVFARSNRGVEVTPFGRSFIRYIAPIQKQLDQVNNMFMLNRQGCSLSFVLANDGFGFSNEICARLFKKYQSVGIRIEQFDSYGDESRTLVSNSTADVGVIRIWNCYKKIEMRQFESLNLAFHPVFESGLAIMVGPGNPLFYSDLEYVTADMMDGYPMVKYGYVDHGPFSDIVTRLGLHTDNSTYVTSSRSVINDVVKYTNAYYLNTDFSPLHPNGNPYTEKRSFPLKGGPDIRSEIGWIARQNIQLSPVALEFTRMLEEWFVLP